MSKPKRPAYSEKRATEILARIAGGDSLRTICKDESMPARRTVLYWVADDHKGFRERYTAALEIRTREIEAELVELADGALGLAKGEPGTGEAAAKVAARKIAVDTRKWILTKLMPAKYGDRVSTEISGSNGGPIRTEAKMDPEKERKLDAWLDSIDAECERETRGKG